MKTLTTTLAAVLTASLIGGCLSLTGCDREISKTEKTTVSSDGTVKHKETTVKEKPDGSVTKEESSSKTTQN